MTDRWTETRPGRWERDGIVVRRTRHGRGGSLSSWRAHFPNGRHGGSSDTAEAAMAYADEHEARVMARPVDDSGSYTNPVVDSERPDSDTQTAGGRPSEAREAIARIVDPHSFVPYTGCADGTDALIAEVVRQSKEEALRKADRILAVIAPALASAQDGLILKSNPALIREYADDAREILDGGGRPGSMARACLDLETLQTALASAQRERDEAQKALERDRSTVIITVNKMRDAINGRAWLLEGGRGPYSWDDDRFRSEFAGALKEIGAPLERLRQIGRDWSNCPTDPKEIADARADLKAQCDTLKARVAELEAGLRPFAKEAGEWADSVPDGHRSLCTEPGTTCAHPGSETTFTVGDLRHARALLNGGSDGR